MRVRAVEAGGYVLAGGRSSRMGTDKALLLLGGETLIAHATAKLRSVCGEVSILSGNPELARYAPLVPDVHPGCGPIGGMEAALLHSRFDWNLFLPVDMPFVPASFMRDWIAVGTQQGSDARVCFFTIEGREQPAFCLLHREMGPLLTAAIGRGEFKLMHVFSAAADLVASNLGCSLEVVLSNVAIGRTEGSREGGSSFGMEADPEWFSNLNTPDDFASAQGHGG